MTTRLLLGHVSKECVRGNTGLDRKIGTRGGTISGVGIVVTGRLSGGEN